MFKVAYQINFFSKICYVKFYLVIDFLEEAESILKFL